MKKSATQAELWRIILSESNKLSKDIMNWWKGEKSKKASIPKRKKQFKQKRKAKASWTAGEALAAEL
jgi:hypothetical protein